MGESVGASGKMVILVELARNTIMKDAIIKASGKKANTRALESFRMKMA